VGERVSLASTSKNSGRAAGGGETPTERVKVRGTCATSRVNGRRKRRAHHVTAAAVHKDHSRRATPQLREDFFFFFVYSLLACDLSRSWRGYVQSVSCPLSARWRLVASTPFALRPGLSHGDVKRTGRITSAAA